MPVNKPNLTEIKSHSVTNCLLCSSSGTILFKDLTDRLYQSPGKWNLRKCNNSTCNLIWLDPRPDIDEVWKVYNNYYTHSDNNSSLIYRIQQWIESGYLCIAYGYKQNITFAQKLIGLLVYFLPTEKVEYDFNVFELKKSEKGKLLDVGCGNGGFISSLKKKGWDVEGIDSDNKAVNFCINNGLDVKLGDLNSQNYADNTFDFVTLSHVIEHVYNPVELLNEIYRILKPGGQIILATPNSKSWMFNKKFKSKWFALQSPGHVQIFDRNNLGKLLSTCGFSVKPNKTSARNEFYVYVGSRSIKERGYFAMGVEKPNKLHLIIGKFFQLNTWFRLHFNKDAGGELFIKAEK